MARSASDVATLLAQAAGPVHTVAPARQGVTYGPRARQPRPHRPDRRRRADGDLGVIGKDQGVVAGPGAASTGYATPAMIGFAGGTLSFTNLDVVQHDVTATEFVSQSTCTAVISSIAETSRWLRR